MAEQVEPSPDIPVKDRAEPLKFAALAAHGYLGEEGEILDKKIEDVIYDTVVNAVCNKTGERKAVAITRTVLTKTVVPNMPGPGEFQEHEDPEAAEMAWSMVHEFVWRKCDSNASGPVQQRLNGEHALVLCRTNATGEKGVWGVYVTRSWACLKVDFIKPDQKKIERAINQMAANGEMGAERLPEFGKKFRTELSAETKRYLAGGVDKINRM